MSGRHRHRHGPIFWRIYLHGVLLLVLVGIAVGVVGFALRHGRGDDSRRVAGYAADRIAQLAGTPARLDEELRRVREVFGVDGTVYGRDGRPIATSVEPPLETPFGGGAPPREGPVHVRGRGIGWAVPLPGIGGHLVISGEPRGHDPMRGLLFIGAVLVALALGSVPLARSISAPLETLTATARRIGAGDLSARSNVKARGEVGELGRAFDEMAARLEALVRGERELLANVSHELRTPLARIRVALELAAEGDRERARRHLAEIGADLSELDALIDDVLTAARLDARGAGAWPVARDPVDLAAVVRDAAERFREAHPDRLLEVDVDPAAPPASGDAALLRRLVAILLDNAAKYSDAPAPVTLALRAAAAGPALEVRDRGIRRGRRRPAAALHAVLPHRAQPRARDAGHRPRPRARPPHRRGARRDDPRRERAGSGDDVPRGSARCHSGLSAAPARRRDPAT